jgi:hypothetical protein
VVIKRDRLRASGLMRSRHSTVSFLREKISLFDMSSHRPKKGGGRCMNLIETEAIVVDVLAVLGVDGVEFSSRRRGSEERRGEELREAIQRWLEEFCVHIEVINGVLTICILHIMQWKKKKKKKKELEKLR